MSMSINPTKWSPDTKKNTATVGVLGLAGAGANYIQKKATYNSYNWNSAINKPLKALANSEKEFFGSKFLKKAAAKIAEKSTKFVESGREFFGSKILRNAAAGIAEKSAKLANSEKEFFGSKFLKNTAAKIAKKSARQKLLFGLAAVTIGTVMGIREHFSKQKGEKIATDKFSKKIEAKNKKLQAKDRLMNRLEVEVGLQDDKIKNYEDTIDKLEAAAEKLGVAEDLANELKKQMEPEEK